MTLDRFGCVAATALGLAACGVTDHHCDVSGHACTWLGQTNQTGFNGDGHSPTGTLIYWSMATLFASDGTTWFLDWNNHIVRRVMQNGKVVTYVGWTDPIFPGDGDQAAPMLERTTGAPGTDVQLNHPTDLYELSDGSILLMAWHNHKIRKIDPATGNVFILGGAGAGFAGDGGPLTAALFKQPSKFAFDEAENMYILDQQNERIRYVDHATNVITTVVGSGMKGYAGDGGPALMAQLNFAVGSNPEPEGGLAYANHTLYIADTENHRIRAVDLNTKIITTIAGTGTSGYSGDGGPATQAQLYLPHALRIGPEGDLYVADTNNGVVRAISLTDGTIRTVAGTGNLGYNSEGRLATDTELNRPFGVDFDLTGNLYISDSLNSRIVRVAK